MKYSRIISLVVVGLALLAMLGQMGNGAQAASGSGGGSAPSASSHALNLAPGARVTDNKTITGTLNVVNVSQDGAAIYARSYPNLNISEGLFAYGRMGVVGEGTGTQNGFGVIGHTSSSQGRGVFGVTDGHLSTGVEGLSCYPGPGSSPTIWPNCDHSALAGFFAGDRTDGIAVQVGGKVEASGFVIGGSYSVMVRYHGSEPLHIGDVLALDGNNETFDGGQILGTVKADASNMDGAIGVVQHRYIVFPAVPAPPNAPASPAVALASQPRAQVDSEATTFQPGDLVEVVVVGQAQMKVSGNVKVDNRLMLDGDGNVTIAPRGSSDSIGKVASKPGAQGMVTVFVNFK